MFYRCKIFTSMMEPFSSQQCDPNWFKKTFHNSSWGEEDEMHDILFSGFNPIVMWSRLNYVKTGLREAPYQPNPVVRKFGLSQLLPKCFIPKGEPFFSSTDNNTEKWLKGSHKYFFLKTSFPSGFRLSIILSLYSRV